MFEILKTDDGYLFIYKGSCFKCASLFNVTHPFKKKTNIIGFSCPNCGDKVRIGFGKPVGGTT